MTLVRILAGLGVVAATTGVWLASIQHDRVERYRPVPAVILESRAEHYRTRTGSGRRAVIRYRYATHDGAYEGDRIYPGPLSSTSGEIPSLLARFRAGTATTAYVDPDDPTRAYLVRKRSFLPYLLVLLAGAPLGALAAGLATGGVRFVRSGEREPPAPRHDARGFHVVPAFRDQRRLRNAAAAAFAVFGAAGLFAFPDHFGRGGDPGVLAALCLLAWLALMARLGWSVARLTWAARQVEDASLGLRPRSPQAGRTLHLAFEQAVRARVFVSAVDLVLIARRRTSRLRAGKVRSKTVRAARVRLRLPVEAHVFPGAPLQAEGSLEVPEDAAPAGGILSWHVEARTRMAGPDYRTRFFIAAEED